MYAALIGAAVSLISNMIGQVKSDEQRARAQRLLEEQFGHLKGIDIPKLTDLAVKQQGTSMGTSPEAAQARGLQMKALEGLGREVDFRGMTPEDRAAYQQAQLAAGQTAAGLRGAVEQQAAQRGLAQGMGSYVGALTGAQGAANMAAGQGMQAAAQSRQRYLQALEGLGQGAGSMRGQDYQAAAAQDAINRFNAEQQARGAQQYYNNQLGQYGLGVEQAQMLSGLGMQGADRTQRQAATYGAAGNQMIMGLGALADTRGKQTKQDEEDYTTTDPADY